MELSLRMILIQKLSVKLFQQRYYPFILIL